MKNTTRSLMSALLLILFGGVTAEAQIPPARTVRIGTGVGWNEITAPFNSQPINNSGAYSDGALVSLGNTQYTRYYSPDKHLWVGRRVIGSTAWTVSDTGFVELDIADSHCYATLGVDGDNYLHVSWGHHVDPLRYIKSTAPGSLTMTTKLSMQGLTPTTPTNVTYPYFFSLPDGNLLFEYRLGTSAAGNNTIQRYDKATGTWTQINNPNPIIRGTVGPPWQQTDVYAYHNGWALDSQNRMHWSWNWRTFYTQTATSNSWNQSYARSPANSFGAVWEKMDGTDYVLPITKTTAEVAWLIQTNHGLINGGSMAVDNFDVPLILTQWDVSGNLYTNGSVRTRVLLWHNGSNWQTNHVPLTMSSFNSPLVVDRYNRLLIFYRHGSTLRCAYSMDRTNWAYTNLSANFMGDPGFDRQRFDYGDGRFNIFSQYQTNASMNVVEWDGLSPEREPIADATVQNTVPDTNFGTHTNIVAALNAVATMDGFLRFDVSGLSTVTNARLRLVPVILGTDVTNAVFEFSYVPTDSWSEKTITWNNRPASSTVLGTKLGSELVVGTPFEIDITTSAIAEANNSNDGLLSIRIRSSSSGVGRRVDLASRQHYNLGWRPLLVYSGSTSAPPTQAFVTNQTLGTLRTNFTGWVGMKITVGATPVLVQELGRWVVAGNTGTHTVKLTQASTNGADIASVSINTAGAPAGFKYAPLLVPVTLAANTSYYLVSQETINADQWYDLNTVVTHTGVATIPKTVYKSTGNYVEGGSADRSYVPVSFKY